DIDEFDKYELLIDYQIRNKDLSFFDLTYNRLMQRIKESRNYYKDVLDKPINYSVDEQTNTDYEKQPYAITIGQLKERWRKQVKLSALSSLTDKIELQEKGKIADVKGNEIVDKVTGKIKEDPLTKDKSDEVKIEKKSFEQLEKETRDSSLKSLNEYFGFIDDLNREDWFSVYVNAIASRFDPHTSYFAPEEKDRFDISMSGKLEGIGARLQKKNDFTEITELISGGPAWRQKELEPGDVILKVAQGNKEAVDV